MSRLSIQRQVDVGSHWLKRIRCTPNAFLHLCLLISVGFVWISTPDYAMKVVSAHAFFLPSGVNNSKFRVDVHAECQVDFRSQCLTLNSVRL